MVDPIRRPTVCAKSVLPRNTGFQTKPNPQQLYWEGERTDIPLKSELELLAAIGAAQPVSLQELEALREKLTFQQNYQLRFASVWRSMPPDETIPTL
jgi:hypothetical protein